MLHVFKGEILANMTQVSDVAPGPLVIVTEAKMDTIVFSFKSYIGDAKNA
jgi:hypothetical protein